MQTQLLLACVLSHPLTPMVMLKGSSSVQANPAKAFEFLQEKAIIVINLATAYLNIQQITLTPLPIKFHI